MTKLLKLALVSTLLVGSLSTYAFEASATLGVSSLWTQIISATVSLGGLSDVDYIALKDDATNFLANDVSSDALASFIDELRSTDENLKNFSDKEIALAIVTH